MAMAIQELGEPAVSFTGVQVGIRTDSTHTKARIKEIATDTMRQALAEGKIVIVAGFQGVDEKANITTLGRGGSETTAVALAAALKLAISAESAVRGPQSAVNGPGTADRGLGMDLCLGRVRTDERLGFCVDVDECEDSEEVEDCVRRIAGPYEVKIPLNRQMIINSRICEDSGRSKF